MLKGKLTTWTFVFKLCIHVLKPPLRKLMLCDLGQLIQVGGPFGWFKFNKLG